MSNSCLVEPLVETRIAQQTAGLQMNLQNGCRRSCLGKAMANLTASTRRHRVP